MGVVFGINHPPLAIEAEGALAFSVALQGFVSVARHLLSGSNAIGLDGGNPQIDLLLQSFRELGNVFPKLASELNLRFHITVIILF